MAKYGLKLFTRLHRVLALILRNNNFKSPLLPPLSSYDSLHLMLSIATSFCESKTNHGMSVLFSLTSAALTNSKAHLAFTKLADPRCTCDSRQLIP